MDKPKNGRLRTGKRAVVEVQFNWIFVLIAGALILAFFIIIIGKQKGVSDKKISVAVLNSMDQITSGQRTSENRQDMIKLSSISMGYSCGGCDCTFSVGGMSKSKGNLVIFAPGMMMSDTVLTWTQNWDMPFRVTNFVYMTIPEIRYYFVVPNGPGDDFGYINEDFIKALPVNLSYEVVDSADSITYKGEKRVRIVYFDLDDITVPVSLQKLQDSAVSALLLEGVSSSEWYKGNSDAVFFRKSGADFVEDMDEEGITNSYPIMGMQTAYGAVYSDSFQNFRCNMDDAVKRLSLVSDVYSRRSDTLSLKAENGEIYSGCAAFYSVIYFDGFSIEKENLAEPGQADDEVAELYDSIDLLTSYNEGAIINSCPRIY